MRTEINKKSDFDFIVLDSEGNAINMPSNDFTLDIWTWGSKCRFRASSIGGVLKGCNNDGGKLRVYVDNPGFVPGKLVGEWVSYISSEEYQDGMQRTCRYISDFGIDMVDGDSTTNEQQVLAMMQYIQGASAYEIACEHGYQGTEEEWLNSLSLESVNAANECRELMAQLSAAEDERNANEQNRNVAEDERSATEQARVTAENNRAKSEADRNAAEKNRATAELNRDFHESTRSTAETQRVSAENERIVNEQSRVASEESRVTAEKSRQAAEQARETAEVSRAAAEEERKRTHNRLKTAMREYADAESLREESEAERREAEQYRIEYEATRQSSEATRLTNERNRVTAEQQRVTNETARSNAESNRATSETARQSAETARQSAEQGRVTAEQARADAEAARAEEFATFEGKIAAKEDVANKVTSIGADANNTTFPTTRAVLNSIAEVKNIEVTPEMLSESTKQYINASGGGTITNLADDEDLTSVDGMLKLANKDYSPTSYSGMGRIYLRKNMVDGKNILTQEMMTKENTIYIIQYDYDLNGATINVPANCTLDFQGGSLGNGTLSGTHTIICAPNYMIFALTLKLAGSFDSCARPEWYGTYPNIKSVCLADSCNRLYEAFGTIVLDVGKYYLYSGNSINVNNLNGVNKDSNIWVSNIHEGYCPLILGKVGGTPNERLWGKTISNLSVYVEGSDIHQTSCLTVGATTRCYISNVIFWNYSARIAEYTEEEFADPISNSSYAIVFDGSTELLKISGFTFSADIPMLFKSGCDFLTVSEGYCEVKQYGFGGIYMGRALGSNCTFENFDIALGIYPIYIHNTTVGNGYCNFVNLRFEQVRKPDFISDVACNIYIDGEVYIDKVVFSKIVFSSNTNGLLFKGSANIFMDNTGNYFDISKNNYYLKIEGDNIKIKAINCEAGFNTGIQIPDGYVKDGLLSSVMYGNTYNTTKFGYITRIYKTIYTGFSSTFLSDGSFKYSLHEERHYTKQYNLLLSFKDVKNFQLIKCVVIDIEIFDNDNYAKASVLFKFAKDEEGNRTNVIDDYYIISSIGDDIFSKTIISGKFAIIAKGQSYIEVYNKVSTDLYANVDINLYTSSIL